MKPNNSGLGSPLMGLSANLICSMRSSIVAFAMTAYSLSAFSLSALAFLLHSGISKFYHDECYQAYCQSDQKQMQGQLKIVQKSKEYQEIICFDLVANAFAAACCSNSFTKQKFADLTLFVSFQLNCSIFHNQGFYCFIDLYLLIQSLFYVTEC